MLRKAEQVNAYIELLLRYNATHNLLKRNTKQEIIDNDLKDILPFYNEFKSAKRVLDYGSGAGIPGILLAIEHPNINFVIAESIQKKAFFIKKVSPCGKCAPRAACCQICLLYTSDAADE